MRDLVIYHADCMDGVTAAACWKSYKRDSVFIPLQHGTIEKNEWIEKAISIHNPKHRIVILDFSFTVSEMVDLCNHFNKVLVVDHHKTFEKDAKILLIMNIRGLEIVFDVGKSAATLTYDYLELVGHNHMSFNREFVEYVQDRDIWTWELPMSKEVSESMRQHVFKNKNHITNFLEMVNLIEINNLKEQGESIVGYKEGVVLSSITEDKLKEVTLQGVTFKLLNCNTNISEVGNEICLKYDTPALMYFIVPDGDVIFSMRSTDELPDISIVAKIYGGGGHRNAAGFKSSFEFLMEFYR